MEEEDRYRTFWPRFWAGLIDGLVFQTLAWLDHWVWGNVAASTVLVGWFLTSSFAILAYSIILHGLFGQTLGKRLLGVRVYDIRGGKLSMRQAVLRDAVPLGLVAIGVAVDLPTVVSGRNPYDPATFAFSKLSALQLLPLWGSLVWFLVELLTMLLNPRRRAVHDLIAKSVVMRVSLPEPEAVGVHRGAS